MGFLIEHASQIASFIVGMAGGSLLTFQLTRNKTVKGGSIVDQSRSSARGDVVGGNKTTTTKP